MKEFWIWFMYANCQAFMILAVVFYTSQDSVVDDGKTFNFWAGGHHVYMNCVLLANLIILKMQHNWTGFNMIIIFLQIMSYFAILFYFSFVLPGDVLYRIGEEFMSSYVAWLGCFFCISSMCTIDMMLHAMRVTLGQCCDKPDHYTHPEDLDLTEAKMSVQRTSTKVTKTSI